MSNGRSKGCFKYGCVGCLSLGALAVALIFLFSALRLTFEPAEPRPEERSASHELPEPPELPAVPYPGEDAPDLPELGALPEAPRTGAGRIVLDLSMGSFIVRPGPADEPVHVEADYDSGSFELRESFVQGDDDNWTYELGFKARRGFLGMLMRGGVQSGENRVELTIPRGHPVEIVGKIGLGESKIDLGGLWVRTVDLDLGTGEHFIEFRDPLPFPMERFAVDGSIGELEIRKLGDASPREVVVDHSIGELFLDLQGTWRQDAEVDVKCGIGECRLWLPQNARVDVRRATVGIGESNVERPDRALPEDAPTLTLDMSSNIGEVRIEY